MKGISRAVGMRCGESMLRSGARYAICADAGTLPEGTHSPQESCKSRQGLWRERQIDGWH
jgi:hypothetical protein